VIARDNSLRRFFGPLILLLVTMVIGVIGYMVIEGWSFTDSLFMMATSITTVGYGEVHPLSAVGRIFSIGLIFVGLGSIYYLFGTGVGLIFEGHLNRRWEHRRMEKRIDSLDGHYIICGFGRVGQQVAETLVRQKQPFVIVDIDPTVIESVLIDHPLLVVGNATEDATLARAGIERAGGLITAVATDADNVFVTLSARALRPGMPIVARANHDDVIPKLRRAGATQVVSPYAMAGQQMALLAARPATVNFVETLLGGIDVDLILEDVRIERGSLIVGMPSSDARRQLAKGAVFLAVKRDGRVLAPPPIEHQFQAEDVIAAVGTAEQLRALEEACQSRVDVPEIA